MTERVGRTGRFLSLATIAILLHGPAQVLGAQARRLPEDAVIAWASLLSVLDVRSADTLVIDRALASPVAPLRAAAARVVGMNRVQARYARLRTLLRTDTDSAVASDAAFALGLAVDSASCAALREALPRPRAGAAAAWALGELGSRCGDLSSLLSTTRSSSTRGALLRGAAKWTPFPDSAVMKAYGAARTLEERRAALYAFSRARRPVAANLAWAATRDADAPLREIGARLLVAAVQLPVDTSRVITRLDSILQDRVSHVRIAAVRAAASYRGAAEPILQRAWQRETDVNVRVTLAQSLGAVASDTSALWGTWWRADSTHMVRRSLLTSAWQAGAVDALGVGGVDSLFASPDFRTRVAMVEGAAAAALDRNARRITDRLGDRDDRVRAAALTALANASQSVRDSLAWPDIVESALRDADVGVRQAALSSFRRTATAADLETALSGYQRALRDPAGDAREASLDIVVAAWRRDSAGFDSLARGRLQLLDAPADPLLRDRVRTVTPLAHWKTAPPAPASVAVYEQVVRRIVVPSLAGRPPSLRLDTERGVVRIVLDGVQAPLTADHFLRLSGQGYFRDLRFHRVVPAFVAQGGDPRGDGSGGPGFAIRDELNRSPYVRGAVGMALSGPDTGGSQFFLTLAPQPHLDGHYTVFGRVVAGAVVVDRLVQGDVMRNISPAPQ
ncbi:MAG TPA: peptidylprolyl isomerase [Gemmatimonadaceae bacterium]|nr:peptidylprolyl isomerase [Gemmatimonadaceae bacterium]